MSEHSVVDAKNQLSALIDRARAGEHVVITRHGQPMVELRPVQPIPKGPVSKADWDWIFDRAVTLRPGGPGAVETLLQLREEDRIIDIIEGVVRDD